MKVTFASDATQSQSGSSCHRPSTLQLRIAAAFAAFIMTHRFQGRPRSLTGGTSSHREEGSLLHDAASAGTAVARWLKKAAIVATS